LTANSNGPILATHSNNNKQQNGIDMKQMLKKELSIKGGLTLCMEAAGLAFVMALSAFTLVLIANLPFVAVS